ncbi:MAG TPA: hypothetical protein VEI02_10875 [Planctomycetota bacterium]|nr:hypothetical protein [Planctomycetota bacterium]
MTVLRNPATFWAATAALVVAAGVTWFMKVVPEERALESAAREAEALRAEAARLMPTASGHAYAQSVEQFAVARRRLAQDFEAQRLRAAGKLSQWFSELTIPEGADKPARDEFQRGYAFHRDRLDNEIRDLVRRAGGPEIREAAIMKPAFLNGPPPKEDEMLRWQRLANVERFLLEAAAQQAGYPMQALEVSEEAAPLNDPDPGYLRYRVRGRFATPTARVADLLTALVHGGDEYGVLTRLDGAAVEPAAPDAPKAADADPPVAVAVSLALGFPTAVPGGAAR